MSGSPAGRDRKGGATDEESRLAADRPQRPPVAGPPPEDGPPGGGYRASALRLAPSFAKLLRRAAVELEGQGGVVVHGRAITFPVTTGKLEPLEARRTIAHGGQLVFWAGRRKLPCEACS